LSRPLRIASCMAPSADPMCRDLATWLAAQLEMTVELVDDVRWQERERQLDAGLIDLCWICGLPYVEKADNRAAIELCVAPVMRAPRYANRPIYYSDVVVRSDSAYRTFGDLKGQTWAYNEPRSHSGFGVVCYHLAGRGETLAYFGGLVEAGTHQAALRLVRAGIAAGAAIDSTVLEAELARFPNIARDFRVVHTLGPSPAPPWVMSSRLPAELRLRLTRCLSSMMREPDGAAILASWGIAELREVRPADYDPMREMMRVAGRAGLNAGRT
jgi:phosphonate transport system substrate-binding protein